MSLAFLTPTSGGEVVARSPIERQAAAAGARFEVRDGWNVAVEIGAGASGASAPGASDTVGWADVSHLEKYELQGPSEALEASAGVSLPFGVAVRRGDAWWCRLTPTRALAIGAAPDLGGAAGVAVVDVTSTFAALTLVGPLARETFARFCALDLRPRVTPVGALRPGSVGRQPAILIREGEERYLFLFGWATAEYMWSVVSDAGEHLGGRALGVDQLAAFPIVAAEVDAKEAEASGA
ncbi:MAG: hypothetical protein FWD04_01825 [Conexibacteraceae bacterium]|nr:hypothetical protein [Conexibacteraceae bacterium]